MTRSAYVFSAGVVLALGAAAGCSQSSQQGKIAFTRWGREYHDPRIWVMNPDGSGQKQLTQGDDYRPAWSPDGTRIAFRRDRLDREPGFKVDIFVVKGDGTGEVNLTGDVGKESECIDAAWSPDGTKIAFHLGHRERLDCHIFVMNADGSAKTRLTDGPGIDTHPTWSPAGKRIAFVRAEFVPPEAGTPTELMVMDADGSNASPIAGGVGGPAWSPDGKRIAFHTGGSICVVNADGTQRTALTEDSVAAAQPAWSPDGTKIVYTRGAPLSGEQQIWVMNADGTEHRRLTRPEGMDSDPAWWGPRGASAPTEGRGR